MQQHHQSSHSQEVGAVGEADEEYGSDVMNNLLLEILEDSHTGIHMHTQTHVRTHRRTHTDTHTHTHHRRTHINHNHKLLEK